MKHAKTPRPKMALTLQMRAPILPIPNSSLIRVRVRNRLFLTTPTLTNAYEEVKASEFTESITKWTHRPRVSDFP